MEIQVAVPVPIQGTFTYQTSTAVPVGVRVLVPFGPRKLLGVVLGEKAAERFENTKEIKIKSVSKIVDETPVYSANVLKLAQWMSEYYMHPIGEVLKTMLPAGAGTSKVTRLDLTDEGRAVRDGLTTSDIDMKDGLLALFGPKKPNILAVTAEKKFKKAGRADFAELLKALKKHRFISIIKDARVRAREATSSREGGQEHNSVPTDDRQLTPSQSEAVEKIWGEGPASWKVQNTKPWLLWGVTGSGKTEVYTQLIAHTLDHVQRIDDGHAQILLMVPEISLTPQMTTVFSDRFPSRVAVVHSAMTDTERWAQIERVRSGEASILIGPRSAVFAPFQNLKMIIVDEEHDSSYKQTTGLTYHGRDVAVFRARLEGACVVLGSATPSLETFHNAHSGRYNLARLPERIAKGGLPEVRVIAGSSRSHKQGIVVARPGHIYEDPSTLESVNIDESIVSAIKETVASGQQAMVLVNRRGFAHYLFSATKNAAVQCPHCSISLTLHNRSKVLRCHYCEYETTLKKLSEERSEEIFVAIGSGSQKVEDALKVEIPGLRVSRVDSDTVQNRDYLPQMLTEFREGKIDVLVGTQMLAKGHDFPKVTLIAIIEVDQMLGFPDFRSGERTFQLLVQASGRAGRAELSGRVIVQTMQPNHPVVAMALKHDYESFAQRELQMRKEHLHPPFARMISLEWSSSDVNHIRQLEERVNGWVTTFETRYPELLNDVRLIGPMPPPIEVIRGRFRRHILLLGTSIQKLHKLADSLATAFEGGQRDLRLKIDVDPQSIL